VLAYSYHSDGHCKATLEDVFKGLNQTQLQKGRAPWHMGWQTNERNIIWNDDLKLRLLMVRNVACTASWLPTLWAWLMVCAHSNPLRPCNTRDQARRVMVILLGSYFVLLCQSSTHPLR
jgi:hypothetical protein